MYGPVGEMGLGSGSHHRTQKMVYKTNIKHKQNKAVLFPWNWVLLQSIYLVQPKLKHSKLRLPNQIMLHSGVCALNRTQMGKVLCTYFEVPYFFKPVKFKCSPTHQINSTVALIHKFIFRQMAIHIKSCDLRLCGSS